MNRKRLLIWASTAVLGVAAALFVTTPAQAAPSFQLPFPCGQTWGGNASASSAHNGKEIDFNRGGSASADLGDTVTAAAAGTVRTAAHQGSANGYGNLVKIEHSGGFFTYYAHLNVLAVKAGERVLQGQAIGQVGNTSKPGNNISPHLHYEVREGSSGYPGNLRNAVFNGRTFGYPIASITSNNCANSYSTKTLCGTGYRVIDAVAIDSLGVVELAWNGSSNCVVTLKHASVGTATATSAYVEPAGSSRATDSGNFTHYAGPVRKAAPGCVKWGGATGGSSYNSPSEHCG